MSLPENALLRIEDVSVVYGTKEQALEALTGIRLSVYDGECVCLLGPSGCGKSTLLNLIAGFLLPSSGGVYFEGERVRGPSYERGVVFQEPTLYNWLSVSENIAFGLRMRGMPASEISGRVSRFLGLTGLTDFASYPPYALSGGMKQRVALARILVGDPKLLLMDEPFSALDPATRQEMQDLLLSLRERNHCTVLLVTHDINEALFLADRILLFSARPGRIVDEIDLRTISFTDRRSDIIERPDMTQLHKRIMNGVTNSI